MIEGSDGADHSLQGLALGKNFPFLPMGSQVTGKDLTVIQDA